VFIPKYRQKRLYGKLREDLKEIIRTLCEYKKVEIVNGAVCKDHIHLNVQIPPKLSISQFMGYLKGKSALMIYDKHPEQRSKWDKSFWAKGYYVATVGTITEAVVKKYINEQEKESRAEDKSGSAM
jgi:putative transposase